MTWTKEIHDLAMSMWTEGHSAKKIGDRIGKTRNAVMSKVNAAGLQRKANGNPALTPKVKAKPPPRPPKPSVVPVVVKPPPPPKIKIVEPILIPTEKVELDMEARKETWVPFLECSDSRCKWIVDTLTCCGAPSMISEGRPYCADHCKIAYRVNEPPRNLRPFRRR